MKSSSAHSSSTRASFGLRSWTHRAESWRTPLAASFREQSFIFIFLASLEKKICLTLEDLAWDTKNNSILVIGVGQFSQGGLVQRTIGINGDNHLETPLKVTNLKKAEIPYPQGNPGRRTDGFYVQIFTAAELILHYMHTEPSGMICVAFS